MHPSRYSHGATFLWLQVSGALVGVKASGLFEVDCGVAMQGCLDATLPPLICLFASGRLRDGVPRTATATEALIQCSMTSAPTRDDHNSSQAMGR